MFVLLLPLRDCSNGEGRQRLSANVDDVVLAEEWIVLGGVFVQQSVNPTFELGNDLILAGAEKLVESQIVLFEAV